ncbi:MAG: aryl-sulfate sulfotransferase [Bacteroidales bacterium]|nr:aryl-sulfate sulfotransferase [Bacteroidales bacterium]
MTPFHHFKYSSFFIPSIVLLVIWMNLLSPASAQSQNFPPLEIEIHDSSSASGYFFILPYQAMPPFLYEHPMLILDSLARTVFYAVIPGTSGMNSTIDFKLHPNGQMSFFSYLDQKFFIMDSTFQVTDTLVTANGFDADPHEMLITVENHKFILATETRVMNLTGYLWFGTNHIQPGSAIAQVQGTVIQEFDESNNLIWEWKAHDHFAFGDVAEIWLRNPNVVDWTHANAIEQDADGNILISQRHFNEITKINHPNGTIKWRFGGKNNQFTVANDPVGFTGQHDIRRQANGHITLLDNGQYNLITTARAVEYSMNELAHTASLVWEYIPDTSVFSNSLGSHRMSASGKHLIDFGRLSEDLPWMVFLNQDKSKILEINCPSGYVSYRAFLYDTLPWTLNRPVIECVKSGNNYLLEAEPGHPEYRWSTGATTQSIPITQPGTYWVFVPQGVGYIASEYFTVTDSENPCNLTGISSSLIASGPWIEVAPNPVSGKATITFNTCKGFSSTLALIDLTGRVVNQFGGESFSPGEHMINFETSGLQKGIYLLQLRTGDQTTVKKLFVP